MSKIGHDIRLVVVGTKRSQILDADEQFVLEFGKDEKLREDFENGSELINSFMETSYQRGDVIVSLQVDGNDLIRNAIIETLNEYAMNVDDCMSEICAMPCFSNGDPADIYELVMQVLLTLKNDSEDVDHGEY
jgi:hypothetical protein